MNLFLYFTELAINKQAWFRSFIWHCQLVCKMLVCFWYGLIASDTKEYKSHFGLVVSGLQLAIRLYILLR